MKRYVKVGSDCMGQTLHVLGTSPEHEVIQFLRGLSRDDSNGLMTAAAIGKFLSENPDAFPESSDPDDLDTLCKYMSIPRSGKRMEAVSTLIGLYDDGVLSQYLRSWWDRLQRYKENYF